MEVEHIVSFTDWVMMKFCEQNEILDSLSEELDSNHCCIDKLKAITMELERDLLQHLHMQLSESMDTD